MRKQSKQLMILLLVFVFLVAGYFGLQKIYQVHDDKLREETNPALINIERDDIISFSFNYEGETHALEKKDEVWYYTADHSIEMNQYRILAMLNKVSPLRYEQEITNVTDMAQYGLDEPSKVITINTNTASYTIEVGDYNSFLSTYYVKVPSETTVYAVAAQNVTTFDRTLEDLKETSSTESTTAAQ